MKDLPGKILRSTKHPAWLGKNQASFTWRASKKHGSALSGTPGFPANPKEPKVFPESWYLAPKKKMAPKLKGGTSLFHPDSD